jgi:RNA polymerase sigma factor (sigma-70 family)
MTRTHRGTGGRRGHIAGFDAAFYAYHILHLRKRLLRMGFVGEDVDDLVQHTFIVAQDSWGECPRGRGRQRNWLEGIAWRQGMNLCRNKQRQGELVGQESLDSFVADELDVEDIIDTRRAFMVAFAELLAVDREMLLEYYVDGLSLTEIATRYGLPRSTAWSRLQKLRRDAAERTLRLRA